jgi:outer membrane protein OmpA-like peptidoglycan-associated protein
MISKINSKKESSMMRLFNNLAINSLVFIALLGLSNKMSAQAQEVQYSKPSWWFGVAGGANFNFYRGSTQQLTADFTPPTAFHNGDGVGLFLAPLLEFHRPESRWGFMFQAGYDSRKGSFNEVITPCNCPADLTTKLTYITVEPSLRFAPFKSNFYLYGGPRLAFNLDKSFVYEQKTNPDYPIQIANPDVEGDLSDVENTIFSMQIGAGYDIPISSQTSKTQFVLSPFVTFQPYFGQNPRSTETWNLTTLRAGIALKFGSGHKIEVSEVAVLDKEVQFSIDKPKYVTVEKRTREVFPLRNYVFFDAGSTTIPNRYVLLNKDQVKNFKEENVQLKTSINKSGRSQRQMIVYYNILNILGDRMAKYPNTTIKLVGSSDEDKVDGSKMAASIRDYLVNIFGVNASRISIEGRIKPEVPSEQPGGKLELDLLREGDRRVSIETNSPELLVEFQTGPNTPLKSVELLDSQQTPTDNTVTFNVAGSTEAFNTWILETKDEKGNIQKFGPYTEDSITLTGKSIMGSQPEGDYSVTMTGQTKSGKTVVKTSKIHLIPFVTPKIEESLRFSVLYEFNKSKSVLIYEKYLTDIVTPKIPIGGTVIIHGHTDIIGEEDYNQTLSLARVNDVRNIIEKSLEKAGRKDVKFETYGYGEDLRITPFENRFPEERFYNRTVIIDIEINK